jgi:hypothetical protein
MSELIVTARAARAQQARGIDRRASVRYSLQVPAAFCHPVADMMNDACWKAAKVQDISAGGIALVVSRYLAPGTVLAVELDGVPHRLLASVVHTRRGTGKAWFAGCEFLRPLTDAELHAVV